MKTPIKLNSAKQSNKINKLWVPFSRLIEFETTRLAAEVPKDPKNCFVVWKKALALVLSDKDILSSVFVIIVLIGKFLPTVNPI